MDVMNSPQFLTNPGLIGLYKGVSGVYLTRIPFWNVLENPWATLEPIMKSYPDISVKLTPLCKALLIDKNAYLSKQLIASYTQSKLKSSDSSKIYNSMVDEGLLSITDLTHKIGVLKWVFDQVLWD
jgi:hypothetical protein